MRLENDQSENEINKLKDLEFSQSQIINELTEELR